jgi:iron complex transport system ATP-binding protein
MSLPLQIENVSFAYGPQTILRDISFTVEGGGFLAVAGPNGAGKSTLLNLICGLLRPQRGRIRIDACDIHSYSVKALARKVAVVHQEFVPAFDFTVAEIVAMARTPYMSAFGFESQTDKEIIDQVLDMTDTARFASRPLASLSAGERQRVLIARAVAQDTPILLLDEPATFLDLKHQVDLHDLLKKMQLEMNKTILAVTHDINLSAQYCDQALLLTTDLARRWLFGKTADVFSQQQVEQVFGVKTFSCSVGKEKFFLPLGRLAKDSPSD